jgi:hypothetical protein
MTSARPSRGGPLWQFAGRPAATRAEPTTTLQLLHTAPAPRGWHQLPEGTSTRRSLHHGRSTCGPQRLDFIRGELAAGFFIWCHDAASSTWWASSRLRGSETDLLCGGQIRLAAGRTRSGGHGGLRQADVSATSSRQDKCPPSSL